MQSSRSFLRTAALLAIFAIAAFFSRAPAVAQNTSANDIDRSIKPGDDFYQYANGSWLKIAATPANPPGYDTRTMLRERTAQRVRDLIQEAASSTGGVVAASP